MRPVDLFVAGFFSELTVFEAVKYSARFRLPPDYSDAEINQRVEQTLKDK